MRVRIGGDEKASAIWQRQRQRQSEIESIDNATQSGIGMSGEMQWQTSGSDRIGQRELLEESRGEERKHKRAMRSGAARRET